MVERLNEYEFGFERLEVWQSALNLFANIYKTTEHFPKNEIYGLISQLRRAAVSISSNIAEGISKSFMKEQEDFQKSHLGALWKF
jgi:four helix bundle protein